MFRRTDCTSYFVSTTGRFSGRFARTKGARLPKSNRSTSRYKNTKAFSAWFWGLGIPAAVLGLVLGLGSGALVLLMIYPLQIARLAVRGGRSPRENWWRAGFMVLGKFPELLGQIKFLFHRHLGGESGLIEYK